jgi:hypothetical protein
MHQHFGATPPQQLSQSPCRALKSRMSLRTRTLAVVRGSDEVAAASHAVLNVAHKRPKDLVGLSPRRQSEGARASVAGIMLNRASDARRRLPGRPPCRADSAGAADVPRAGEETARRSAGTRAGVSVADESVNRSLISPITARTGCRMRRAWPGPNDHCRKAGSSCSKKVAASASACSMAGRRNEARGTARATARGAGGAKPPGLECSA